MVTGARVPRVNMFYFIRGSLVKVNIAAHVSQSHSVAAHVELKVTMLDGHDTKFSISAAAVC